jgi:hypothetical protein
MSGKSAATTQATPHLTMSLQRLQKRSNQRLTNKKAGEITGLFVL